jgi:arginine utilization protein RocB
VLLKVKGKVRVSTIIMSLHFGCLGIERYQQFCNWAFF